MAHPHTVLRSVNLDGGLRCVDLFNRPDGSHGFEEFRRDPEDGRGWYPIGHYADRRFATATEALAAAKDAVAGLEDGAS